MDGTTLDMLDEFEDHPNLYTRTPTHCHLIPPAQSSQSPAHPPSSEDTHTAQSTRSCTVECETYIASDFVDTALQMPFLDSYDNSKLPEEMRVVAARERSEECNDTFLQSLYSIKKTL